MAGNIATANPTHHFEDGENEILAGLVSFPSSGSWCMMRWSYTGSSNENLLSTLRVDDSQVLKYVCHCIGNLAK